MTTPKFYSSAQFKDVGRHASRRVPIAAPGDSVNQILHAMRGRQYDSAAVIAVVEENRLIGLVTIERLLAASPDVAVHRIMDADPVIVGSATAQEQAAWMASQRDEPTLAVVEEGRFMGLVPANVLLEVLLAEHDEDMTRLGGFLRSASAAQTTTLEPVLRRLWHRLPWLVVGLLGALLAAGVVGSFEDILTKHVLIAFFMPGVIYLADAIGTQTEALVIRGLSLDIAVRKIALREITTGLLLGLILGALSLLLVGLIWQDFHVALSVAIALLAAALISTLIALALPWLLSKIGKDPAFGSGPLATVLQDLLTVLIYLTVASLLVL